MANNEDLARLQQGVAVWNDWRETNIPEAWVDRSEDLSGANLYSANLSGANLYGVNLAVADLICADLGGADLREACLRSAHLVGANLSGACLRKADLSEAHLVGTNLSEADLSEACLHKADLRGAYLVGARLKWADLSKADLVGAKLFEAKLARAKLARAKLSGAYLQLADLSRADLSKADLSEADFIRADLTGADLIGCRIYGISAWDVKLEGAKQRDLVITPGDQSVITVDNLEVAQFIYLLLHNEKIRDVIDTITSKVVLILGRFTPERKAVLDALREELRKHQYLPVLFDFDKPSSKDLTGTVSTLANMARFVIADLTEPSCIPHELAIVIPNTVVPVQPILVSGQTEYAMFVDFKKRYHWVLEPYRYDSRN